MKKEYEVEIQRSNITPRRFFSICKKELMKRANVELEMWCESFEDWGSPFSPVSIISNHEDWETPIKEICKIQPYEWQLFLGKAYNFIMEFQFDDEKKGYGYMYIVSFER